MIPFGEAIVKHHNGSKRTLLIATLLSLGLFPTSSSAYGPGYVVLEGGGGWVDSSDAPKPWAQPVVDYIVNHAVWTPAYPQSGGQKAVVVVDSYVPSGACAGYEVMFDKLPNVVSYCVNIYSPADVNTIKAQMIRNAGAVFFPGGDQSDFIKKIRGTIIEDAVLYVFKQGGVLAGTSGGAMILSSLVHGSRNGTLYSEDAIANPYAPEVDPVRDFLESVLPQTFCDTHFTERGRISRILLYHGRAIKDWGYDPAAFHSFGIQPRTAAAISPKGVAEIFGEGHAGVFWADSDRFACDLRPNVPIGIRGLKAAFLTNGFKFDLKTNKVIFTPSYAIKTGHPPTPKFNGKKIKDAGAETNDLNRSGEFYLENGNCCLDDCRYDLEYGNLAESRGSALFGNAILATDFWDDVVCGKDPCEEFLGYESKFGGLLWLAFRHSQRTGILMSRGTTIQIKKTGQMSVSASGCFPVIVLDTYGALMVAQSQWHFDAHPNAHQECAIVPMIVFSLNGQAGFNTYDLAHHASK